MTIIVSTGGATAHELGELDPCRAKVQSRQVAGGPLGKQVRLPGAFVAGLEVQAAVEVSRPDRLGVDDVEATPNVEAPERPQEPMGDGSSADEDGPVQRYRAGLPSFGNAEIPQA